MMAATTTANAPIMAAITAGFFHTEPDSEGDIFFFRLMVFYNAERLRSVDTKRLGPVYPNLNYLPKPHLRNWLYDELLGVHSLP